MATDNKVQNSNALPTAITESDQQQQQSPPPPQQPQPNVQSVDIIIPPVAVEKEIIEVEIIPKGYSLIRFPKEKSCFRKVMWFVIWPIHLLFMFTIPDCTRPRLKKLFPITFLMCIVWIGSLSYMVAWMITIIGKHMEINFVYEKYLDNYLERLRSL